MNRKLFPSDKNYSLKDVQDYQKDPLLFYLVEYVKEFYLNEHNPLGLIDSTILKINNTYDYPLEPLYEFYYDLAAIYRYQHGEVQLQFIFDGRSQEEKYMDEWESYFKKSIQEYCYNIHFLKAVLEISVFHPKDRIAHLAGNRMKYFIEQHFELKVYKYRGIQKRKAS